MFIGLLIRDKNGRQGREWISCQCTDDMIHQSQNMKSFPK